MEAAFHSVLCHLLTFLMRSKGIFTSFLYHALVNLNHSISDADMGLNILR